MKSAASNVSVPLRAPLPSFSSLTRQSSIYMLTLEELQNAVNEPGKGFGSMNMEEFLKNICTVEECQAMTNAIEGNNSSSITGSTSYLPSGLQRQTSLSLPKNLSGKTVDEVWKEIHQASNHYTATNNVYQRQMTLGETTLEDFLMKAGVVIEEIEVEPSSNSNNSVVTGIGSSSQTSQATSSEADLLNFQLKNNMPHQHLLQYQHQLVQQTQHQNQYQVDAATGFPGMLVAPSVVKASLPSSTNSNGFDTPYDAATGSLSLAVSGRKRFFDMHEEKSVDPRQKRMIKNRESAARSRARKQAYTVELESVVTLLKEENAKILQQQVQRNLHYKISKIDHTIVFGNNHVVPQKPHKAEMTKRRRKELMQILVPVTSKIVRPKRTLRRTQSATW